MKDTEPIAQLAEDGRVHGLEEHLIGTADRNIWFNPKEG
jgi:hypothetical protein